MSDESQYSESEFQIQSTYLHFDLSVLEQYQNDPHYEYIEYDAGGRISIRESYFLEHIDETDEFLKGFTFCFSYDPYQERKAVAVSPHNFSYLSQANRNYWNSKKLTGMYRVDRKCTQMVIEGKWGE